MLLSETKWGGMPGSAGLRASLFTKWQESAVLFSCGVGFWSHTLAHTVASVFAAKLFDVLTHSDIYAHRLIGQFVFVIFVLARDHKVSETKQL